MSNEIQKAKKVKELEIKYNFLHRETWGGFPNAVDERYVRFCHSKGVNPIAPSYKCGYITNWKDYLNITTGCKSIDDVIAYFEDEIKYINICKQEIKDESEDGLTPYERMKLGII
jgi:hypothetical protein